MRNRLADLTGSEGSAQALTELRLPAHCLLRILLRRQVLDDLLQRLGALDCVCGLSCRYLLRGLDRQLNRVGYLLLRPKGVELRDRPWVLRREGRAGDGAKAAADRAEDTRIVLAADSRIEHLGEVALVISVISVAVKFCHVNSPCLLCQAGCRGATPRFACPRRFD